MHRPVAVATFIVSLVIPLFSAAYAQSCPPPTPPPITLQNAEICVGASDAASTPSGMTGYSWSVTHGSVLSSDQTGNVMFSSDGSGDVVLSVTVTDTNGCPATNSVTVPLHSIDSPTITAPAQMCPQGAGADIGVSDPAGGGSWLAVQWDATNGYFYNPNTYPYQSTSATGSMVHVYPDGSGQPVALHARVTDNQYCMADATATIGIRTIAAPVITAPAQVCPNGSGGDLSVADPAEGGMWSNVMWDVTNAYFYNPYSYPNQSTSTSGNLVHFYPDGSGQPITVRVRVFDGQNCMNEATTTIAMRSIAPPVITAPAGVCPNGSGGDLSVADPAEGGMWSNVMWDVTNAYFYNPYSYPNQSTSTSGNLVHFYPDGSGQPITVRVRVFDGQNCMNEATATIGMRSIAPPVITAPAGVCPNGSGGDLSVADPAEGGMWSNVMWDVTNAYFYNPYSYPNQSTSTSGNLVHFYPDGSGQPITVRVRVFDGQNCMNEATTTIAMRSIAPPVITAPAQVCPNGSGDLSVGDPAEGGTWSYVVWDVTNAHFYDPNAYPSSQSTSASGTLVHFYADGAGQPITVRVRAYDGQNCMTEATTTIGTETIAAPEIHVLYPDICPSNGFNGAGIGSPASGSWTNIVWTIEHGTITSGTNNADIYFTGDGSGIAPVVHVTVQDDRGCTATNSATVTIRTIAAPEIHVLYPDICPSNGFNGAGIGSPASGSWTNIVWTIEHGTITSGTNNADIYFTGDGSGIAPVVHVTVQDDRGCTATNSATVSIRTIAAPAVTASGPTTFCAGGSVTLSAPAGFTSYLWSSGATAQSIFVGGTGNYSVTVTDGAGCTATSAATSVVVNAAAAPAITFNVPSFCPETDVVASAPAGYASYAWSASAGLLTSGQGTNSFTISHPGTADLTVSLTVTDSNGCSATSSATLPVRNFPKPTITADATTTCPNGVVHATASDGPYTSYSWYISNATIISGAGTSHIAFSPTGAGLMTIDLTVNGTDSCFAFADEVSVAVDVPNATITASGPTTFCPGGSVTLTSSSGSSYLWSNGATTQATTVNAAGNYSVTVTDANGCSATSAATAVTVNNPVKPTITADGPTAFCDWSKVTLTSSTAASFLWSNGATTSSITVTTGGSYSVTVIDQNGCSATSDPVVVTVDPPIAQPTATAQGSTSICPGGSVTMTVAANGGGNGVYSYQWYGTSGPIAGATSATYAVSPAGSTYYYAVVSDSIGCSSTASNAIVVTMNSSPSATITAPAAVCDGQTSSASVGDAGIGATYTWTVTGGTLESTMSNGAAAFFHNDPGSSSVTLNVTVTTAAGCSASSQQTLSVNPTPVATISTGGSTTFCRGGSVTLSAPAGMSQYSWSDGSTTQSITVSDNGVYSVWVTNSSGCSAHSNDVTVTVNNNPSPSITAPAAICSGATGSASTAAITGASYAWTITNGTITGGNGTNAITFTSSSGPASLGVTVTNSSNCGASANAAVTVNPMPNATITAPSAICSGSTASASVSAIAGASYSWAITNGTITSGSGTNVIAFTSSSGPVSLGVTVTSNGCSTNGSTSVAVNALPNASITAPSAICSGSTASASVSAITGASYAWTITNGTITSGSGTNAIAFTSSSGPVSLGVTVTSNGCSTNGSTTVAVNALPNATITAAAAICSGSTASASVSAVAGASYSWTITNGTITGGSGTNTIAFTSSSGPVSLGVTVTSNGCSTSGSTTVAVNALPNATITAPTAICSGSTGSASVAAVSGNTYSWSISGGTITGGGGTSAITFTSTGANLSLSITVTNSNGCSASSSKNVAVNANPATPTITAGGPTTFCQGGSVTLSAPAASSYHWSDGETTQSIVVSANGTFWVTVTNASGCTSTQSASVIVTVNPSTMITQQPASKTITRNTTTSLSVTATGTGTLHYQWYNPTSPNNNDTTRPVGTDSPNFTTPKLGHGTYYYYVVVTGSCGTVRSAIATITAN